LPQGEQQQQPEQGARRGPPPLVCEQFQGINQGTSRTGVADEQMFWLDGFLAISPRELRTLWGVGAPIFLASTNNRGTTVVCFYMYNIGANPFAAVFLSDGSVVQVNTQTGVTTQILSPGTIINPLITQLGISQYGSQYLLIVANQPNGYWVWDGGVLFASGGLRPLVEMTNVGAGYVSQPSMVASGGSGGGATFTANISNGEITSINVTNPGRGYFAGDTPTLSISGGNQAGSGASLTAVLLLISGGSGGAITLQFSGYSGYNFTLLNAVVSNPGSGYNGVSASIGLGNATGTPHFHWGPNNTTTTSPPGLSLTISGGQIVGVTIVPNPGNPSNLWWVQGSVISFPAATVTALTFYTVNSVTINNGGTGYGPNIAIIVSGGGSPQAQAQITPVVSGGVIIGTNIINGGIYLSNVAPTLTVTDSAINATATISLMPFGIQGTAVQTYAGHVWVFNGAVFNVSAPGSVTDFATSDGGSSQQSNDNFLRIGYTQAVQTNGFLFILGDSSMNYISGVQTTTSGVTVTLSFGNNNSDPEVGTPYPAAVTTLGQDIFIANAAGVFVSSGGTFVKKSDTLDDLWNSIPVIQNPTGPVFFGGGQLSAAKATIFGKRIWMVLVPIIDPFTNMQTNKLFMYNGKYWSAAHQDIGLQFITGQEINSEFIAWGTDGNGIYPLFQTPSPNIQKVVQSKLWDAPGGYDHEKSVVNVFALAKFLGTKNLEYQLSVDNENGVPPTVQWENNLLQPAQWVNNTPQFMSWSPNVYIGTPKTAVWINAFGAPVTWTNSLNQSVIWSMTGAMMIAVLPPTTVGQVGVVVGFTASTYCDDMVLISMAIQPELLGYRA